MKKTVASESESSIQHHPAAPKTGPAENALKPPSSESDILVCWTHNWEDCPANLEVIALSEVV